jgi:hypothetical protein
MNKIILANDKFLKKLDLKIPIFNFFTDFFSLTMARPQDKPRKIGKTSERQIIEAVELVLNDNLSIKAVANAKGVPVQTLHQLC